MHCTVYSLERGQIWNRTALTVIRERSVQMPELAECISVWGGNQMLCNPCINKTAFPQTTVLCFIPWPNHRVGIGHIKLSDKVKKWINPRNCSLCYCQVAGAKPESLFCTFLHFTFPFTIGDKLKTAKIYFQNQIHDFTMLDNEGKWNKLKKYVDWSIFQRKWQ